MHEAPPAPERAHARVFALQGGPRNQSIPSYLLLIGTVCRMQCLGRALQGTRGFWLWPAVWAAGEGGALCMLCCILVGMRFQAFSR